MVCFSFGVKLQTSGNSKPAAEHRVTERLICFLSVSVTLWLFYEGLTCSKYYSLVRLPLRHPQNEDFPRKSLSIMNIVF